MTDIPGNVVNVITEAPGTGTVAGATSDVYTDSTTGDVVTTDTTFSTGTTIATVSQVAVNTAGTVIATYNLAADGTANESDYSSSGVLEAYKAVNADGSYVTDNLALGGYTNGAVDGSSATVQAEGSAIVTYTTVDGSGNLVSTGYDTAANVSRYEIGNQDLDLVNGQMVYYQRESEIGNSVQGESIQVDAAGHILEYSDLIYGSNVDGVGVTVGGAVTLYYTEALGTHKGVMAEYDATTGPSARIYRSLTPAARATPIRRSTMRRARLRPAAMRPPRAFR